MTQKRKRRPKVHSLVVPFDEAVADFIEANGGEIADDEDMAEVVFAQEKQLDDYLASEGLVVRDEKD